MQYFQKNEAAIQAEQAALEKTNERGVNAPMLYLMAGTTFVRILPAFSAAGVFFSTMSKHRVRVGNRTESLACPAHRGLQCLLCDKGEEFTNSKDDAKMAFARENLRPREQFLYNVLSTGGPANKKGESPVFGKVYAMETSISVHKQIIGLDQDTVAGWHDISSPEHGVTLSIKRVGQGLNTVYEVHPTGQGRTNLFADCQARGVDPNSLVLNNLDEVYTLPTLEQQQEVVSQIGSFSAPARPTLLPVAAPVSMPVPAQPVAQPTTFTPQPVTVVQPVQTFAPVTTQPVPQPVAPVAPRPVAPPIPPPPPQR